jgi:hypothetical protein
MSNRFSPKGAEQIDLTPGFPQSLGHGLRIQKLLEVCEAI